MRRQRLVPSHRSATIPPEDLHAVREAGVRPVEARRVVVGPAQPVHEVEHEQCAHPVVREALPHLHAEQQREPARLAEKRRLDVAGRRNPVCRDRDRVVLE
jgi:hypothetical protein